MIANEVDGRKDDDDLPEFDNPAESEAEIEEERLDFADDEEQLPWLESADDTDEPGPDTGRIIGFALVGLLALAAIVGGIWWASNRASNPALVADGSTIQAPDKPYKSKPQDPGGKTFAGTGDASFKVGEGQTSEGRVASKPAPEPEAASDPAGDKAKATPPAKAADKPEQVSGVPVQVGAYSSKQDAQAGWNTLHGRHESLKGVNYRIVEGQADIGTVYRLQAMAGDLAAAKSLCERLKAEGAACQVKR